MTKPRTFTLAILLMGIGGAAFRLSFDAQVTLAVASGVNTGLGWLYPIVVDAAIFAVVLITIWMPTLKKKLNRYLWIAIGFWTATSVLGNAVHVLALPPDRITVTLALAIAVNTIPALTLFLVIHIATSTAFKPARTVTERPTTEPQRSQTLVRPRGARTPAHRPDVPPVSDEEILAMVERGMSLQQIGDDIGRSKSYAGNRVRDAKARAELTA